MDFLRELGIDLPIIQAPMAGDHELCRAVLGGFIRGLLTFERRRAEWRGVRNARGGAADGGLDSRSCAWAAVAAPCS